MASRNGYTAIDQAGRDAGQALLDMFRAADDFRRNNPGKTAALILMLIAAAFVIWWQASQDNDSNQHAALPWSSISTPRPNISTTTAPHFNVSTRAPTPSDIINVTTPAPTPCNPAGGRICPQR